MKSSGTSTRRFADDHRSIVEIADTGIGMTEEEVTLALQPFRQVDSSHARKYEGTGLGLTLAKALAELHGGSLRIDSKKGVGTTITVALPAGNSVIDATDSRTSAASPQEREPDHRPVELDREWLRSNRGLSAFDAS